MDAYLNGNASSFQLLWNMEVWSFRQREGRQFTRLKGLTWLADDRLPLSCADFGEMHTGGYDWEELEVPASHHPYPNGGIGLSVRDGGHISCRSIEMAPSLTES